MISHNLWKYKFNMAKEKNHFSLLKKINKIIKYSIEYENHLKQTDITFVFIILISFYNHNIICLYIA